MDPEKNIVRIATLIDLVVRETDGVYLHVKTETDFVPHASEVAQATGIVHVGGVARDKDTLWSHNRAKELREDIRQLETTQRTTSMVDEKALVGLKVRAHMIDQGEQGEARYVKHALQKCRSFFNLPTLCLFWLERLPDVDGDYLHWYLCVAQLDSESLPSPLEARMHDWHGVRIHRYKMTWNDQGSLASLHYPSTYKSPPLSFRRGCLVFLRMLAGQVSQRVVFPYLQQQSIDPLLSKSLMLQHLNSSTWNLLFAVTRPQMAMLKGSFTRLPIDSRLRTPVPLVVPVSDECLEYDIMGGFALHFNVQMTFPSPPETRTLPCVQMYVKDGPTYQFKVPGRGHGYIQDLKWASLRMTVSHFRSDIPPPDKYEIFAIRIVLGRTCATDPAIEMEVGLSGPFEGMCLGTSYNRVRAEHSRGLMIQQRSMRDPLCSPVLCRVDTHGNVEWD